MKFLFQKNIWQEYAYDRLLNSVQENDIDLEEVMVIPFTDVLNPEIDYIPDYIFGSGRFVNICRDRDFPTFNSFKPFETFYPARYWINSFGYDVTWGKVQLDRPQFIKPYREKFFTARVFENNEDLGKVQLSTSFIEDENQELVRVSDPIFIRDEIRFFVIGGEVITGSYYRINRINKQKQIDQSHDAWQFLKNLIKKEGAIDSGFVIDFGLVEGEWKIVELNNLNSAGIYECDTNAIIRALKYLK